MRALVLSLFAAATWVLAACEPQPAPVGPALWRIADADSEIWLFGSVHVLPTNLAWRSRRVNTAFAASAELMTETDVSEAARSSFPALAARYGASPDGIGLSGRLRTNESARLARLARELGLDLTALEQLRPWLAALQLSYASASRAGHVAEAGVEAVLVAEARRSGKRLSFLETPEQQIRSLASLAPADELHFLAVTIRQIEEEPELIDSLDNAWARGDVAELARQLNVQWREAGAGVHNALILERNRVWADEIARRLEGAGRVFVAVGAAHLVGEDSVIALLRARGIEVDDP